MSKFDIINKKFFFITTMYTILKKTADPKSRILKPTF